MPEGVECLIVAESIQRWAKGQDIDQIGNVSFNLEAMYNEVIARHSPIHYREWNNNNRLDKLDYTRIATFGKIIFLPFEDYRLSIQLGMTGAFSENSTIYSRAKFYSDYSPLYYDDMRKFGNLMFFHREHPPRNIGSLLRNSIDWRNVDAPRLFAERVVRRKKWINSEIKPLLINQQLIAGIGNIYACEGLLRARIDPRKKIKDLHPEQLEQIIVECKRVMDQSYSIGGMSVYTFTSFGKQGFGKKHLKVYSKQGKICKQCNSSIVQRIRQQNRSAYYCPTCQIK